MNFGVLLDLIFPPTCLGCGTSLRGGEVICDACTASIPLNHTFFCGECGARLPLARKICHPRALYLLGAASSYRHPALHNLIRGLKFQYLERAAEPLAALLAAYAETLPFPFKGYVAVPVPLGRRRERERGFNQAEHIARRFADRLSLPCEAGALVRTRDTAAQSEARSAESRRENVRGCFAVRRGDAITKKNIVLIDDVTTSGATLREAARALKDAGARKIVALTVARA